MAIDITNIIKSLQEKIGSANTTNSTPQDLIYMMETAKLIDDGCVVETYANTDVFPAASGSKRLAFDELNRTLYFNNGSEWKQYDLTVPDAAEAPAGPRSYGFISGGYTGSTKVTTIESFSFASDGNGSDVGDMTVAQNNHAGQSSATYGYTSGGPDPAPATNVIEKFPFATGGTSTDVGDLAASLYDTAGHQSSDDGYTTGGNFKFSLAASRAIQKHSFSSDGNASNIGNLYSTNSYGPQGHSGHSSSEYGYTAGGYVYQVGTVNWIGSFPFASDSDASDYADLTGNKWTLVGIDSSEYGYSVDGGGNYEKFPFASAGNAADVGDLTQARNSPAGASGTTYGYAAGGGNPTYYNIIDKFPFSSDANATDVGDLTEVKGNGYGHQY
jgi:hypothetical protein